MSFGSWLRQPSTITGIGAVLAAVAGAAAQVMTGDATLSLAAAGAAFTVTHLVINDNTVAADVSKLVETGVTAAMDRQRAPALAPELVRETMTLARDALAAVNAPAAAGVVVDASAKPLK